MNEEKTLSDDILEQIVRVSGRMRNGSATKEDERLYVDLVKQYISYEKQINDQNLELDRLEFDKAKHDDEMQMASESERNKVEIENLQALRDKRKLIVESSLKGAAIAAGLTTAGIYCYTGLKQLAYTMEYGGLLGKDTGVLSAIKSIRF